MEPSVDITFSCLPLRSVGRLDVPLDASGIYRIRHQRLQAALRSRSPERTYYLYDARCIFHLANSEVEGMVRFDFEGVVQTDAGDALTEHVELEMKLAGETCGGIPPEVEAWLRTRVHRAVALEFDRFIAAGQLKRHADELGNFEQLSDLGGFSV